MNVSAILSPWETVHSALGLGQPIRDQAHYEELLAFVDECFERFSADEAHPIFSLLDLVAARIKAYEDSTQPWPETSTPASRLAFLMEQHGLRQNELPEVGAQSVVSAVLSGKRQLNLRQIQGLSRRFGVPMDAFA